MEEPIVRHSIRWLQWKLGVPAELLRALAADAEGEYRPFEITRGNKRRRIDNPSVGMKFVQRRARRRLLAALPLADSVHGCVRGKSPLSIAAPHCGQRNVASVGC